MGLLKKDRAPDELPELAVNNSNDAQAPAASANPASAAPEVAPTTPAPEPAPESPVSAAPEVVEEKKEEASPIPDIPKDSNLDPVMPKEESAAQTPVTNIESSRDPSNKGKIDLENLKSQLNEAEEVNGDGTPKFFDQVLDDINDGIQDLGKLEGWYKDKFSSQDIVSNMKGYWEGNKADILIQSFGNEYKNKIKENIKVLQKLEEDWRVIYFQLIKKEEEMKKVEQQLKSTLSEFVEMCKNRRVEENEHEKKEDKSEREEKTKKDN